MALAPQSTGDLLEREAELVAIAGLLDRTAGGVSDVLLVEGEAGVGKTRLLDAVEELARELPVRVLRARGGELEQSFPFGVAAQLLAPAVAALRRARTPVDVVRCGGVGGPARRLAGGRSGAGCRLGGGVIRAAARAVLVVRRARGAEAVGAGGR